MFNARYADQLPCSRHMASRSVTTATCLLCRDITKAKERRKVYAKATCHIIPTLKKHLSECNPSLTALALHKDAGMCKACVRSIEKLQKL